ncbi:MAG: MarR family winged helix-turn-helix transcriptional regulator [Planctomycetota bacterium]|jgi:DNA-binding MarR family transcriptional regulator
MSPPLPLQAQRFYEVFAELVRGYQFRDREGICCHGLSVSQCYTLETLQAQGPATMSELAGRMFLEVSSMTRIVDHLVTNGLARRSADPHDRRVCRVQITPKGRSRTTRIRAELVKEHELMLREIPAESREAVISAMSHPLTTFKQRQQQRCEVA